METRPINKIIAEQTVAKTGLVMKKLFNAPYSPRPCLRASLRETRTIVLESI